MYISDTILDSPQEDIKNYNGFCSFKAHPYTAYVEIEDDSTEIYSQNCSKIPFSSSSLVNINQTSNNYSLIEQNTLPINGNNKNGKSTSHPSSTSQVEVIHIDSPISSKISNEKILTIEDDCHISSNSTVLKADLRPRIIKKLQNLNIICGKYVKSEESKRPDVVIQFMVSLIEYSGFPKIESNKTLFKGLKSQLIIKPETQNYQLSDNDIYIRIGMSISKSLKNFLKRNPNLTITQESPLPKINMLPNNLLDITICLLCVGFRQIRRYASALLDKIVRYALRNTKYENVGNQILRILVDMRSQDVISDSRIGAYQLLAKHLNSIQFNLTHLLGRGLKDSSIQVRRIVMDIIVDSIKLEEKIDINIPTLLDITYQRFSETFSVKDRADIAKFWSLCVENGATEIYNFEQIILLAKVTSNCIPSYNNFLRECLRRTICINRTGSSLALPNNIDCSSTSPTNHALNIEGLQNIIAYISNLLDNDKILNDVIEIGIFTSNLINATWEVFPFFLDIPIVVDMFDQFETLSQTHGLNKDNFYIIMFSILKQSLKCLINSNDHFISLKNDAIISFLTCFTSLSSKAESDVCYTLLLESLSSISEFIDSINYSINECLEQISNVICNRLCSIEYNSSICIHSLRCLQKFATVCNVDDVLVKFVEMQRKKDYKESLFIMTHIAHTLNWKYLETIVYDLCKIKDFEYSSSNLALLYAFFETGIYTKVKNGSDITVNIEYLGILREKIYEIGFRLLIIDSPHVFDSENDKPISKFSILVTCVILLTMQLENLIIGKRIKQHVLTDTEENILSRIFFTTFNQQTPVLLVQKSIFASLVTHQLPLNNVERIHYWENDCSDQTETCSSVLAKLFSLTLNTSLYSSSLGALLFCQLCNKNKSLASCAKEFCLLLLKINRTLLYDLLLCVITFKPDSIESESEDVKIAEKETLFMNMCNVFVKITEFETTPKDIKRFILNAVNYIMVETPNNYHFILNIVKLFMNSSFLASIEWKDLKKSLKKSSNHSLYSEITSILIN